MNTEQRLRRRRALYRIRRDNETSEERDERLRRRREARRRIHAARSAEERQNILQRRREARRRMHAAQSAEERQSILQRRREAYASNQLQSNTEFQPQQPIPQYNDPDIIATMRQFHDELATLEAVKCSTCLEQFPSIAVNDNGICRRCHNDTKIPKLFSSDNNMDPGAVPPQLTGLSEVEQMLISPIIPLMSIYRLPHGQYGYSGHVINFPQDTASFVNSLPRLTSDLDILVVRKEATVNNHHDFCVRRSKVCAALQWLVTNNKYFSNISINHNHLSTLPEDEIIANIPTVPIPDDESDLQSLTNTLADHNDHMTSPTSATMPTDSSENQSTSHLPRTFVPSIHQTMSEAENIRQSLNLPNTTATWPTQGQTPINEFQHEGYFTCAFPTLYPTGAAEFLSPRMNSVSVGSYFKHLMLYHDGRFAKHPRFRYFALNTEMRWRALQTGRVYIRQNPEDGQLTYEDLQSMVDDGGDNFSNRVLRYASSLRGTRQYWMQQRSRLISMVDTLGMPTIFFTHSAADLHWPELARLFASHNPGGDGASVVENPALADWFFYHRAVKFVASFYVDILKASDYWYRFEYQHRGSPHIHGVAWLSHAPDVIEVLQDDNPTARCELINFIDSLVCTNNPAVLPDSSNLENAPSANVNPHICSQPYSEIEDHSTDLNSLVATCQRHTRCSTSYCLRTTHGQQECRFGYPKPLVEETTIVNKDGVYELQTARNDPLVNSYNPIQLSAWRANVDMKYLVSKQKVIEYCAKYATKCEPRSQSMRETFQMVVNQLKNDSNSVTAVQKLLINTIAERDYSAQETCHLLLQLPLFKSSRDFIVLSLDDTRMVDTFQQQGELTTVASILDHYIQRPSTPTFNDMTLLTFARSYNTPKEPSNEPTRRRKEVIVIVRPYCSPDPNGTNYEQYCKQKLMLHVKFRQISDLLINSATFIEAYQHYLLSTDVSPSLEDDIRRIQMDQPTESDAEENQFTDQTTNQPNRQLQEWMLICQQRHDLQPSTDPNENVDWTSASHLYTNLQEIPSFIATHRQSALQIGFTSTADPTLLQGKQLLVYNTVKQHFESNNFTALNMIVSGTAGTGKSYIINCLKLLLQSKLRVSAPTGVAAFNIEGYTLHSLFNLPIRGDFKELQGQQLHLLQQSFAEVKYLIIDEMSMIGRKMFGQIDKRLRQIFPHQSQHMLGGCSCILFGDFGQLPPVMDLPLYTTTPRNDLSDLGSTTYHCFNNAVLLDQIMRQHGNNPNQMLFKGILLRLRNGETTISDWEELMKRTPVQAVNDLSLFDNALHLFPTVEAVVDYNLTKLKSINRPIAVIKAVHNGPNAHRASSADEAGGLDPVVHLATTACVMLIANLWVEAGLVNGALGTVLSLCYQSGGPPELPLAVMVRFDNYCGPTLPDNTVPVIPLRRTWSTAGTQCSRLQLPLKLAWAITVHKAQGLTLNKVVIDIGRKEFSSGLTFVACSRVRQLSDLLFATPFSYQRLYNISNSSRLQERISEDQRLQTLQQLIHSSSPSLTLTLQSSPDPLNQTSTSSLPTLYYVTQDDAPPTVSHDTTRSPPMMSHPTSQVQILDSHGASLTMSTSSPSLLEPSTTLSYHTTLTPFPSVMSNLTPPLTASHVQPFNSHDTTPAPTVHDTTLYSYTMSHDRTPSPPTTSKATSSHVHPFNSHDTTPFHPMMSHSTPPSSALHVQPLDPHNTSPSPTMLVHDTTLYYYTMSHDSTLSTTPSPPITSQATSSHVQSLDSHDITTSSHMMSTPSPPLLVHDPIQYSYTTSYDTTPSRTPSPPMILHTPTPSPPLFQHSTTQSPSHQKSPSSSLSHRNTPSPPMMSHNTTQ